MSGRLTEKRLDITFQLGKGSFGESGFNAVKLQGLRASAIVIKAGGASMGGLQLQVWGMTLSKMNQLSTLGHIPFAIRDNTVIVEAGDDDAGMSVVFQGTIAQAWADFQGMPDVVFHVVAYTELYNAMKPVPPTSFRGGADVATIMAGLASRMGLAFENSGVTGQLVDPYLPGTAHEQVQRVATAAGIEWIIDNGKLAIWPKGGSRGGSIPLISPATGMIGYPAFTATGIVVTCRYNPSIGYGSQVEVKSDLKPACGKWTVFSLSYVLDAKIPKGNWFARFEAAPPGYGPPIR